MDVSDALVDYLASIKHLSHGTQTNYQQHLEVFSDWCGNNGIKLEQVNNRAVQRFVEWLKATRRPHKAGLTEISSHTLVDYVRTIWTFLYWCLDDSDYCQYVRLQTIKGIKLPRANKAIKETFTDEEIAALFDACHHESKSEEYQMRDHAMLAVLLDTGIRSEELLTLTIGNTVLARGVQEDSYIKVLGKGRKEREIPLGNRSRRALNRYMRTFRKGAKSTNMVFFSRHGGKITPEALRDIMKRIKQLSRLPANAQVNPHKFRHTFATRFMASGGDVYDLSRLMGHSSVAITEGYLRTLSAEAVRTRRKHLSVLDNL